MGISISLTLTGIAPSEKVYSGAILGPLWRSDPLRSTVLECNDTNLDLIQLEDIDYGESGNVCIFLSLPLFIFLYNFYLPTLFQFSSIWA